MDTVIALKKIKDWTSRITSKQMFGKPKVIMQGKLIAVVYTMLTY